MSGVRIGWLSRWHKRRDCFHHNHRAGQSWVTGTLIDLGARKLWRCGHCGRTWIW